MNDKEALKLLLNGLEIFTEVQPLFTDHFWSEMCEFLAGDDPVDCTWNQIQSFYDCLKEFAKQKGIEGVQQ